VAHEAEGDVVGEAVSEEGFAEIYGAAEDVAADDEGEFSGDEGPEVGEGRGVGGDGENDAIDDEFGDPEEGDGLEGGEEAEGDAGGGEGRGGFPDHGGERGDIAESAEAVAPRRFDRRRGGMHGNLEFIGESGV